MSAGERIPSQYGFLHVEHPTQGLPLPLTHIIPCVLSTVCFLHGWVIVFERVLRWSQLWEREFYLRFRTERRGTPVLLETTPPNPTPLCRARTHFPPPRRHRPSKNYGIEGWAVHSLPSVGSQAPTRFPSVSAYFDRRKTPHSAVETEDLEDPPGAEGGFQGPAEDDMDEQDGARRTH